MVTLEIVEQAHKVVTMGCGVEGICPATLVETKDWELEDPKGKTLEEVRKIRDEAAKRLCERLVYEELKHKLRLEMFYGDFFYGED